LIPLRRTGAKRPIHQRPVRCSRKSVFSIRHKLARQRRKDRYQRPARPGQAVYRQSTCRGAASSCSSVKLGQHFSGHWGYEPRLGCSA
jgi:hypothetical protein